MYASVVLPQTGAQSVLFETAHAQEFVLFPAQNSAENSISLLPIFILAGLAVLILGIVGFARQ
jgi:hypothetical protein